MSASECAGESGSESTSAPARLGDRQGLRRMGGPEVGEVVHGQEVEARADPLLAERLRIGVAVGAGGRARDAHHVDVPAMHAGAAEPAPERGDAREPCEALVIALGLRDAPRVVGIDAVQLAERDAGVEIAEVELVARLEDVVGARALLLVALPRVASEPVSRSEAMRARAARRRG